MDEKELKETLRKLGIAGIDGHIRIDPETGKVQIEGSHLVIANYESFDKGKTWQTTRR